MGLVPGLQTHKLRFKTEKNKLLDPENILIELANIGITSVLLEGGPTIIDSFYKEGLIDEIYQYTSADNIDGSDNMKNPIKIDDSWDYKDGVSLNGDDLKIFQKKEIECLVE